MTGWEIFGLALVVVVLGSFLVMLVRVFADLLSDPSVSGAGKAAWVVALVLFPVLGVLVYLVTRGDGMSERAYQRSAGSSG